MNDRATVIWSQFCLWLLSVPSPYAVYFFPYNRMTIFKQSQLSDHYVGNYNLHTVSCGEAF